MQKTKFKIKGIKCSNCSLLIEERLKNKDGIVKVRVDQTSNKGVVIYDEQKITEQDIYQSIEGINDFHLEKIQEIIPADLGIRKAKFIIRGLKCDNCVLLIESRLKNKDGIVKVRVDQTSNKGVVIYDEQKITEQDIYQVIEEVGGFKVEKIEDGAENSVENINYDNPSIVKEEKPPIKASTGKRVFAAAVVLVLIFQLFTFGNKNNQGNQAKESVKNNNNQQAPAVKTAEKSDSPVLEAYVVSRCPFGIQMQRIMADVVKNITFLVTNIKAR